MWSQGHLSHAPPSEVAVNKTYQLSDRIHPYQSSLGCGMQDSRARFSPLFQANYPMDALFFRFDARKPKSALYEANKLTVDFLESHVQTVHTAETGVFASTLVSPLFFRNLLLAGTHDGSIFRSQRVNSSQIHKVRFVVILVRRLRPSS